MSTYRVGSHWGVTIVREDGGVFCCNRGDHPGHTGAELVAVVVNGDRELAERICALLNGDDEQRAALREWSDVAYELYALACNSTTDGHSTEADWSAAFRRLRDRFHKALAELPSGRASDRPSSPESAQQPPVGGIGGPDGSGTLSAACDCGHEGLDAMFHLSPCPVAELSRAARRGGYELVLSRWEEADDPEAGPCVGICAGCPPDCHLAGDSCSCAPHGPDPGCVVHQGRRAKGPKPPPVGPGCICDGSGRTCPRHGVVL